MKLSLRFLPLLAVGCASGTFAVPRSHIDAANQFIGAAERFSVAETSDRLDTARRELDEANGLLARRQTRQADLMYLRADTDARIVVAQAARVRATAETQRMQSQAQQVQSQVASVCRSAAVQSP